MSNATTLEELRVIIAAYTRPYQDEMRRVRSQTRAVADQVDRQTSRIKGSFKKIAGAVSLLVGGAALTSFAKSCLELGSDLQEVQNVVDVTFGRMSDQVDSFAQNAISQFGLSETVTKKYMGTLGAMAKAYGYSTEEAYNMSAAITGLTADVASFYNLSTDEAYAKMKAIFTGETESLKDLGVVMTQTALDQYALNNGFGKATAKMTEQEKVMLRYQFVMSQLSSAQGDFARTSDGWANQVRVLSLRFDQLKATIGQGLIQVFTPVIKMINTLISHLQTFADYFSAFITSIFGGSTSSVGSSASIVADTMGSAADSANDMASAANDTASAAKEIKKSLQGFDEMNILQDNSSNSGSSGGSSGAGSVLGGLTLGESPIVGAVEQFETNITNSFDKIKAAIAPATEALQRLWNEGLSKLGNFTMGALSDFYNHFLEPVGSWVMGEGLPRFLDITNELLNNIDWGRLRGSLSGFGDALSEFATFAGDVLLDIYDGFFRPLKEFTFSEQIPTILDIFSDLGKMVDWDSIREGIGTFAASIGKVAVTLSRAFLDLLGAFADILSPVFAAALEGIGAALGVIGTALDWLITPLHDALEANAEYDSVIANVNESIRLVNEELLTNAERISGSAQASKDYVDNAGAGEIALARDLKDRYFDLAEQADLTNAQKAEMKQLAGDLVELIPDLAGYIDDETGYLDLQRESVEKLIEARERQYKLEAAKSAIVSAYESQLEAEQNLMRAKEANADIIAQIAEAYGMEADTLRELTESQDAQTRAENEWQMGAEGTYAWAQDYGVASWSILKDAINDAETAMADNNVAIEASEQALRDSTDTIEYLNGVIYDTSTTAKKSWKNTNTETEKGTKAMKKSVDDLAPVLFDEVESAADAYVTDYGNLETTVEVKTGTSVDMLTRMRNTLAGAWKDLEADATISQGTSREEVKGWSAKIKEVWKDQIAKYSVAQGTGKETIKGWVTQNKEVWKDQQAKYSVSQGTSKEVIKGWATQNKETWKDQKAKYSVVQETTANALKKIYQALRAQWPDASSKFGVTTESSSTIKEKGKKIKSYIHQGMTSSSAASDIILKAFKGLLSASLGTVASLKFYANGGFPDQGQMFIAREAGPEMIGTIGGRTAVANNAQIVAAIQAGVFQAVTAAMANQGGSQVNVTLEGDAQGLFRVVQRENNNYVMATGKPAFLT